MIAPKRQPKSYDHRLRELVFRSGRTKTARRIGVPRSTIHGWTKARPRPVATLTAKGDYVASLEKRVYVLHAEGMEACSNQAGVALAYPGLVAEVLSGHTGARRVLIKNHRLYLNELDSANSVCKLIAFYVEQHNSVAPHYAFQNQPPNEMVLGTGANVPSIVHQTGIVFTLPALRFYVPFKNGVKRDSRRGAKTQRRTSFYRRTGALETIARRGVSPYMHVCREVLQDWNLSSIFAWYLFAKRSVCPVACKNGRKNRGRRNGRPGLTSQDLE